MPKRAYLAEPGDGLGTLVEHGHRLALHPAKRLLPFRFFCPSHFPTSNALLLIPPVLLSRETTCTIEIDYPLGTDVACWIRPIDSQGREMYQFKRGLSPEFVTRLNEEYERGGWWQAIADDPSLFIAIRDEYLNVYWKGNSLLKLRMQGDALVGQVHYKYLLRPEISPTPYLQIEGGQVQLGDPATFFLTDLSDIAGLKRAADVYSGDEKTGVHKIVMSNPNIIDVEVAFGTENEHSGAKVAQRIDFVALRQGKGEAELLFYEAKAFANPELRAKGENVPVLKQLKDYGKFLKNSQSNLKTSYQQVCGNLLELRGLRDRFSALHSTFKNIYEGKLDLGINNDVRLVVFGFDQDQKKGTKWETHRSKLLAKLDEREDRLILKGNPQGLTRGIS